VYWLNIYQIPPNTQQQSAQEKKVILPLRIRLKVFVRPIGLPAPEENIGGKLRFTLSNADVQHPVLTASNPTPYYLTIGNIRLGANALKPAMIAPFSSADFTVTGAGNSRELRWTVIDDYGKQMPYQRELSSP
jgi:P pilus assembly chaperone PapD